VPRVERPTINADIQGVPALLGAVVAINAKALQSASQELVPIPLMRNDKARKVDGSRAAHADASSNASSRTSFAMVPDAMLISSFTQPFEALIRPLVD